MRQELVDAFNEIEHTDFKTLEEIKRLYSKADIVVAWLQYEGINRYTSKKLRGLEIAEKGELV